MTFWDFCHAHTWLVVLGGLAVLTVAGLAFIAVEDSFITRQNIERIRAASKGEP